MEKPEQTPYILINSEAARKAREFGIDLALIEQNLRLSPTQRLQKLARRVSQIHRLREGARGA